jgi:hypothetical protein
MELTMYRISPSASEKRDQADFSGVKAMIDSALMTVNRSVRSCSSVVR